MTREEALTMVIDALPDVENFEDAIDVLRASEDGDWKTKYGELQEKYRKRFKDEIMTQPPRAEEPEYKSKSNELDEGKPPKFDDIDFSGETD